MKKSLITLITATLVLPSLFGQSVKNSNKGEEYRRSSLCLYLIDDEDMPKKDTIYKAFMEAEIPNKYNDHNVGERLLKIDINAITEEQRAALEAHKLEYPSDAVKKKTGGIGAIAKAVGGSLLSDMAGGESVFIDPKSKTDFEVGSYHYLLKNNTAKSLMDKWILDNEGNFSTSLICERGLFNASAIDLATAKNTLGGMDILASEGEELINNTFVVISRFRYLSKEEMAEEFQKYAKTLESSNNKNQTGLSDLTGLASKAIMGDGYSVCISSYLFQLVWNDEISSTLYAELWDNKEAYNATDLFKLKYIGFETARAGVKSGGIFAKKTEEDVIRIATINAVDKVLAKLEKKYEVFRTKTPIMVNENGEISAHIGTKEDVEAGDKFEVLERVSDPKTGKISYKNKGTISVAKGKVWNNVYMGDSDSEADENGLTATVFKENGKNYYTGLLIRQKN